MEFIQLFFGVCCTITALNSHVLTFQIFVVKISIKVLVIIDPRPHHMWILLIKIVFFRLPMHQNRLIIAKVISGECRITPKHILTPQVRVLSTFVHGCVGFKLLLDKVFVFVECHFDVFGTGVCGHDAVEVATNDVLLFVETVKVEFTGCEDIFRLQFAQGAFV